MVQPTEGMSDPVEVLIEDSLGIQKKADVLQRALGSDRKPEDQVILDGIGERVNSLPSKDKLRLVGSLCTGIGQENDTWDQDRRDSALGLISLIDLSSVSKEKVLKVYLESLKEVSPEADPYGSIDGLLSATELLIEHMPPGSGTFFLLSNSWNPVKAKYSREDFRYIDTKLRQVLGSVVLDVGVDEDGVGEEGGKLGAREEPEMEIGEQELHDRYLEVTRKEKSFKRVLWDSTPEFRRVAQEIGMPLERFWNFQDPERVNEAFSLVRQLSSPIIEEYLGKALRGLTGIEWSQWTPEYTRVYADQIVQAVDIVKKQLQAAEQNPEQILGRMQQVILAAENKSPKARSKTLNQVASFLKSKGTEVAADTDSINSALQDPATQQNLQLEFSRRQMTKMAFTQLLDAQFNGFERSENCFIGRNESDLYLGDRTGDCTSYHLNVGMNGWTVPVWLSNPGFNFFLINDGNAFLSKLGLVMAVSAQGRPILVIDSLETTRGIKPEDEQRAREKIQQGLRELNQWATQAGFEKVLLNQLTNSESLQVDLEASVSGDNTQGLVVMEGLRGVSELRRNLIGTDVVNERMYLQSIKYEDENKEPYTLPQRQVIRFFEEEINRAIEKANPASRKNLEVSLAEGDWTAVFEQILKIRYPLSAEEIGVDVNIYQALSQGIILDEIGEYNEREVENITIENMSEYFDNKIKSAPVITNEVVMHAYQTRTDIIDNEKIENLLILLQGLSQFDLEPKQIMQRLYGDKMLKDKDSQAISLLESIPRLIA